MSSAVYVQATSGTFAKAFLLAFHSSISRSGTLETYKSTKKVENTKSIKESTKFYALFGNLFVNYILDRSTWFSEIYERVVCTIKSTLKNPVRIVSSDQDQWSTVLIVIENVLRSRLLTSMKDESFDEILTPYH